jgi:ABC-type molybdate transport system substrate-binding protein
MRSLALAALLAVSTAVSAQEVRLYAAGSLRGVMNEIGAAFQQQTGTRVTGEFGSSGLLRDRLAKGEAADVFASANMEHPQALAQGGRAGPVRMFARNRLCALAAPAAKATTDNLLERMLDPALKLATSTPKADPSGDYAWALFARAEAVKPGARAALEARALKLTGGPDSPPPPKDRSVYGMLVADGKADIFLTYCTNAVVAQREQPALQVVQVPSALSVGADYGLTVLQGAGPQGAAFAAFVLSAPAQAILARHGFDTNSTP